MGHMHINRQRSVCGVLWMYGLPCVRGRTHRRMNLPSLSYFLPKTIGLYTRKYYSGRKMATQRSTRQQARGGHGSCHQDGHKKVSTDVGSSYFSGVGRGVAARMRLARGV